jgi:hypothetical protein
VAFCVVLCAEQSGDKVCSDGQKRAPHKGFCGVAFCVVLFAEQSGDKD